MDAWYFLLYILLYFSQLRNTILIIRKHDFIWVFRSNFISKNKSKPSCLCSLQKGNFLCGWLIECLLLELEEINQMAAGDTHLFPLTLINKGQLTLTRRYLALTQD